MIVAYLSSCIVVIGLFAFGVFVSGANATWYLDIPSALVVLVPSFALALGDFGFSGVKAAFAVSLGRRDADRRDLAKALTVLSALGRYAWYSAALGSFIGFIAILGTLGAYDGAAGLGRNAAVALICAFYALLFNFLAIRPLRNRLEIRMADAV